LLEVSNDLLNWETLGTNDASQGTIQFVDPDATAWPYRFYRVVPDTGSQ
jgi:hypothetical protein